MVCHVLPRFWSVGAATTDLEVALLTHRAGLASEPSATLLHNLRVPDVAATDTVLGRVPDITGEPCPRVFLDSRTPAWVEAELVARGWRVESNLQLVLAADTGIELVPDAPIRPAGDADWEELGALFRADHEEEDRKGGRSLRPRSRTDQVVRARRGLVAPVRYFVAELDGIAGFVAEWPGGRDGFGLVEDLFVRPDHRGRDLARALIGQAVTWARSGGARPVVIGAEPDDTPKHLHTRLGFVPTAVLRVASPPQDDEQEAV